MEQKLYDVAIIGGGPGGYTAGLYCARSGFSVVVLEKLSPGGQMATTGQVDNYPGFEGGVDGFELGEKMQRGAERFGVETRFAEVTGVELAAVPKVIQTSEGEVRARAVVLATGASPREMGLPGEQELRGRGVAYCATCDGMMYRNKTVAVLGGGNSAVADALYLSKLCREVYLIHRRDTLRASKVYMDALKDSGIQILWNSRAVGLLRDKRVSGLVLEDVRTRASLWPLAGSRIQSSSGGRWNWTSRGISRLTRRPAPGCRGSSPWGMCGPSPCGRS